MILKDNIAIVTGAGSGSGRSGARNRHSRPSVGNAAVSVPSNAPTGGACINFSKTVTALVADAIMDVSHRSDIVLDAFGGSGATLLAAERTGRRARLIELDPLYVDVAIRRWQAVMRHGYPESAGLWERGPANPL